MTKCVHLTISGQHNCHEDITAAAEQHLAVTFTAVGTVVLMGVGDSVSRHQVMLTGDGSCVNEVAIRPQQLLQPLTLSLSGDSWPVASPHLCVVLLLPR